MSAAKAEVVNEGLLNLRDEMIKTAEGRLAMLALPKTVTTSVLWGAALHAAVSHGTEAELLDQIQAVLQPLIIIVKGREIMAAQPAEERA